MSNRIKIEDNYYISATSTYADSRVFVLNNADTFGVFDLWGDINLIGKEAQGIYHAGTRFVSELEFKVNGERPVLLSSAIREENDILHADLTNVDVIINGEITLIKGSIHISRIKFIKNGMCHEKITLINYNRSAHELNFSFSIDADFKDIFEIRGIKRENRGETVQINKNLEKFTFTYLGLDNISRKTEFTFFPLPDNSIGSELNYKVVLQPLIAFELSYSISFEIGSKSIKTEQMDFYNCYKQLNIQLEKEKKQIAGITTENGFFNHWINRSRVDLISLIAHTPHGRYPYAGIPWYNTAFGRDGIITALEVLWVYPDIAKGVLFYLAQTQSKSTNYYQDSEPGKIFHETREGEMAELGEVPFKLYYGTVDATPLFIVLAGAYYKRTNDLETIKKIWKNIEAALAWIEKYGDLDGDGFVEYQHHSEQGLYNQGWKDSYDSVSHKNGDLANSPIALCEVQAYVFDAKKNASFLANALGFQALSNKLNEEAELLKKKFNEAFWDEELQCFVLALDGNKEPCRVKSSNVGHCLFSGIVNQEYVMPLVNTLFAKEMFSQWGIRTLSSEEVRYNPMSYHNGSVWPHDNALIAFGLARYGLQKEALKILSSFYQATMYIDLQRLPELFCGFERQFGEGPIAYPVACSPQAWAVGALYMLLQACIKIDINAIEKRVTFHKPVLPDFIHRIEIDNLTLGSEVAAIRLQKQIVETESSDVTIMVIKKPADWEIVIIK
ncbi:MAG: amylo-alpha-1,6-glucosidase [Bacteroidetes bacterium]|nr:amylo-alpha-1,6-glucosidase [Bacteroidota bacterium]HET6244503.1 glycogen debranching N-terminal domain-containing protein [Bacteroidia bacterium]